MKFGTTELIVILVVVIIIFGPTQIPKLTTMFGKSVVGIIFLVVIMLVGHAINIGLNALGSYVHTMRLQYVEMFSKFYEGGGKEFEPFSLQSKYIKIQEDK